MIYNRSLKPLHCLLRCFVKEFSYDYIYIVSTTGVYVSSLRQTIPLKGATQSYLLVRLTKVSFHTVPRESISEGHVFGKTSITKMNKICTCCKQIWCFVNYDQIIVFKVLFNLQIDPSYSKQNIQVPLLPTPRKQGIAV